MTRGQAHHRQRLVLALASDQVGGKAAGQSQTPPQSSASVQVERRHGADRRGGPRPQGAIRRGPHGAGFRGRSTAGQTPDDHRLPARPGGVSVAVLFDVSGSMEGHLPNAREAATHVLSWLDDARRGGGLHVRHATRRGAPFTVGLRRRCRTSMTGDRAVRRDVAARRDRADREARRRARGPPPRGRRPDRRRRQRQPAQAGRSLGDRQRDRRAGLHLRHRAVDRQPVGRDRDAARSSDRRSPVRWRTSPPGPADTCSWPARRDSAASRRGRSSTSCGISTSSHSNRAASRAGIRSWSARATRT